VIEVFPFESYKLKYNIAELSKNVIVGNEGDQLGSGDPGVTSIVAFKNANGLEDIFVGAPNSKRAYLLYSN
jgi:hypothetical protein